MDDSQPFFVYLYLALAYTPPLVCIRRGVHVNVCELGTLECGVSAVDKLQNRRDKAVVDVCGAAFLYGRAS